MRRRELLAASAATAVALAGCSSSDNENNDDGGGGDDGPEESSSDDGMEEEESSTDPGEEAVAVVEEFYQSYNDADLEKSNALAHEEFPDEIQAADFEEFGGIENMQWTVDDTEIVRESEGLVEVHADVTVQTLAGTGEDTDYFLLTQEDGEWQYLMFLPRPVRETMSQEEIDQAMRRNS
jgi:hypothetical protein